MLTGRLDIDRKAYNAHTFQIENYVRIFKRSEPLYTYIRMYLDYTANVFFSSYVEKENELDKQNEQHPFSLYTNL